MPTRNEVYQLVEKVIVAFLESQPEKGNIEISDSLSLYGMGAPFDSLDLVSIILSCEEAIKKQWQYKLVLANEKALARKRSPFRSVGSLVDYILELLKDKNG